MLVVATVAIIVVGPKDLPGMLRAFGKTMSSIRRMASDFQRQFNDALKDSELDELKNVASGSFAPLDDAKKSMEEFQSKVKAEIDGRKSSKVAEPEAKAAKSGKAKKTSKAPKTAPKTSSSNAVKPKATATKRAASKAATSKRKTTKSAS